LCEQKSKKNVGSVRETRKNVRKLGDFSTDYKKTCLFGVEKSPSFLCLILHFPAHFLARSGK